MIVGVPTETAEGETRVAVNPARAKELVEAGLEVQISAGAGEAAGWNDETYRKVGCTVVDDRSTIFEQADVILHVRGLGANEGQPVDPYRDGQVVIGLLGPYDAGDELDDLAKRNVSAFALELMPRISRAQTMDALSSQANLGGYKATIVAAETLPKLFPLMMTAAGTIQPAEVFVVGTGVAGLQAIATANRLGATVRAYDIRPEVKEEVESLGAEFVELDLETDETSDEDGHAREMDEEFYRKQREMMMRVVADSDVVITTAAVPGKPSPELVTTEMIEEMDRGSVIVDLAAAGGGNCEPTVADETVVHDGVTISGPTNLPATVPKHASQLYAKNVTDFLEYLIEDGTIEIDTEDEIVDATLLTHAGDRRDPHETDSDRETDSDQQETPNDET